PASLAFLQDNAQGPWFIAAATLALPGKSTADKGHELFHRPPNGDLACASCHAEGRDDGRTWSFAGLGLRRTQSIGGGVRATAPLHWSGDLDDMPALVNEVLSQRMGAGDLDPSDVDALVAWVDALPLLPRAPVSDEASVARGAALFSDPSVGCASCHAG